MPGGSAAVPGSCQLACKEDTVGKGIAPHQPEADPLDEQKDPDSSLECAGDVKGRSHGSDGHFRPSERVGLAVAMGWAGLRGPILIARRDPGQRVLSGSGFLVNGRPRDQEVDRQQNQKNAQHESPPIAEADSSPAFRPFIRLAPDVL